MEILRGPEAVRTLVEHDGLWILVHHLSHVPQHVLLGDDAQETSGGRKQDGGRKTDNAGKLIHLKSSAAFTCNHLADALVQSDLQLSTGTFPRGKIGRAHV